MSYHGLLNLLKKLRIRDNNRGVPSTCSFFRNSIIKEHECIVACLCHSVLSSFRLALWRSAKTK